MRKQPPTDPKKRKGLIIVNTGNGKGKSTASFGLALRAAGNKMNVFILQFMKGKWKAGERISFEKLAEIFFTQSWQASEWARSCQARCARPPGTPRLPKSALRTLAPPPNHCFCQGL